MPHAKDRSPGSGRSAGKEMTGEPFKGELRFGFGGARRPDR
jgi:hypothetical protein